MFKVMWLLKRKDRTSMEDLIDYYENKHSVLAANLFNKHNFKPVKYVRRYLHPMADPIPEKKESREADYDLSMEMWFNSRAEFDHMVDFSTPEEVAEMIVADERHFLNRNQWAVFILEEHETHLD